MTNNIKAVAKRILYGAGYYHLTRRRRKPETPRLVVLMYHDVLDNAARASSNHLDTESPSPQDFSAHVERVVRHYRVLTMRDAVAEMRAEGLREDAVAFTFDDGYASVYSSAFPVLRQHDVAATIFVLTGWVNREGHMWWQELRTIAARSPFPRSAVARIESILGVSLQPAHGHDLATLRRSFLDAAEPWLRGLDEGSLASRLRELRDAALPGMSDLSVRNQALTWDQLREMHEAGIELAAHTHSHINIRHSDPEVVAREIAKSKTEIERNCGGAPVGFAYPYGKDVDFYGPAADILRADGFTYACTAHHGINDDRTDPFFIRRIVLPSTTSTALIDRTLYLAFSADQ